MRSKRLNFFCCFIAIIFCSVCFCQEGKLNFRGFTNFDSIPWNTLLNTEKRLVISAEVHEVSCNYQYKLSLIKALAKHGYNNILLEMPFSYGLVCNEYLKTGDDSLLYFISRTKEAASFWRSLYDFGKSGQIPGLKFWGIDFEIDGGRRGEFFAEAIRILAARRQKQMPEELSSILRELDTTTTNAGMVNIKRKLAKQVNNPVVCSFFEDGYSSFVILVNRQHQYRPGRDENMFANFMEIHRTFLKDKPSQKYFAQFGWGHVRKSNKKCFAMLMAGKPESPVFNSSFFIGTQYINCYSNLPSNERFLNANSGVINSTRTKKQLERISKQGSPICIIDASSVSANPVLASEADLLIVLSNFDAATKLQN
jgi:hypothetical protein